MTKFIFITMVLVPFVVQARDTRLKLSVSEAVEAGKAEKKIDSDVKLIFGTKDGVAIEKSFGEIRTNKKTNAVNKSDQRACHWAFFSSMIALQKKARDLGGNAIVNIRSNYRDQVFNSLDQFECGAGAIVAGTAFIGEVVKVK